jgi:hypothetical protein
MLRVRRLHLIQTNTQNSIENCQIWDTAVVNLALEASRGIILQLEEGVNISLDDISGDNGE